MSDRAEENNLRGVPLTGVQFKEAPELAGRKCAIRRGPHGPVYVSPAMMYLIRTSTPQELAVLLSVIRLIVIPDVATAFEMGMTARYEGPDEDEMRRHRIRTMFGGSL